LNNLLTYTFVICLKDRYIPILLSVESETLELRRQWLKTLF